MIDILLATYNGEKYLEEQILSLLNQENVKIRIIARDDCSTDGTKDILEKYHDLEPDRFFYTINSKNIGINNNFQQLINDSSAPYLMFADQDDVWLQNKVSKMLSAIKKHEAVCGEKPILVFGDKFVTDAALKIISRSHIRYEGLDTGTLTLNKLLLRNSISGCAMIINRSLANLCVTIPKEAIMYDYWIALTAAAFGYIYYIDEPLMYYRQHGENNVGAKSAFSYVSHIKTILKAFNVRYNEIFEQANAFNALNKDKLTLENKALLETFLGVREYRWPKRAITLIKYSFLPKSLMRSLFLLRPW